MNRMRVVMVGPIGAGGGISTVMRTMCANAILLDSCDICAIKTSVYKDGTAIDEARTLLRGWAEYLRCLRSSADRVIIHIHVSHGVSFWRKLGFLVVGRWLGHPVLLHIHSSRCLEFFGGGGGFVQRNAVRLALRLATLVVVLGDAFVQAVAAQAPGTEISAIHNPVSVPPGARQRAATGTSLDGPLNLVFMGLLVPSKGLDDLMRAMAAVVSRGSDMRLTICGKGPDADRLQALGHQLGIDHLVDFAGWIDGAEKWRQLANADALILPSYHEGLPMVILEAMALGRAVVATRIGAVPEAVEDGVTGLLFKAGDLQELEACLERLAADPHFRAAAGQAARLRAKDFEPDDIAELWIDAYRSCLVRD